MTDSVPIEGVSFNLAFGTSSLYTVYVHSVEVLSYRVSQVWLLRCDCVRFSRSRRIRGIRFLSELNRYVTALYRFRIGIPTMEMTHIVFVG